MSYFHVDSMSVCYLGGYLEEIELECISNQFKHSHAADEHTPLILIVVFFVPNMNFPDMIFFQLTLQDNSYQNNYPSIKIFLLNQTAPQNVLNNKIHFNIKMSVY